MSRPPHRLVELCQSLMNRREFSCVSTGTAISAMLHTSLLGQQPPSNISMTSEQAIELSGRALILDCNSGPPWEGGHLPLPQPDLDMVRSSGVNVVKWSIGGLDADFA